MIDTNAWLDLYVFEDAAARPLAQALQAGTVCALRSADTDVELDAVLRRPQFAQRCPPPRREALIARWQADARLVDPVRPAPWSCRDPADQRFLDLAHSAGARFLLTKDRALLALARRTRPLGLLVLAPGDFEGAAAAAAA